MKQFDKVNALKCVGKVTLCLRLIKFSNSKNFQIIYTVLCITVCATVQFCGNRFWYDVFA